MAMPGHARTRPVPKEEEEEAEDPLDARIGRTGCAEQHRELQQCMAEQRDWRRCQPQLRAFRDCMARRQARPPAQPAPAGTELPPGD